MQRWLVVYYFVFCFCVILDYYQIWFGGFLLFFYTKSAGQLQKILLFSVVTLAINLAWIYYVNSKGSVSCKITRQNMRMMTFFFFFFVFFYEVIFFIFTQKLLFCQSFYFLSLPIESQKSSLKLSPHKICHSPNLSPFPPKQKFFAHKNSHFPKFSNNTDLWLMTF